MARIRTTKPEFWDDECLGKMSILARLTFLALKDLADDEGRGLGDPDAIWAAAHKYQSSGVKAGFKRALSELGPTLERQGSASEAPIERPHSASEAGAKRPSSASEATANWTYSASGACKTCGKPHVIFYKVDGCSYYWLPRFKKHQKIDKPSPSKLPPPPFSTNPRDYSPLDLDQGSGSGSVSGSKEEVASPPPTSPSAGTTETPEEPPKEPGTEEREVDKTVAAFGFCNSPGIGAKQAAIRDLRRIGISHEFIRSIARKQEQKPFYEIIRSIEKGKAKPDFKPSPPPPKTCRRCGDLRRISDPKALAGEAKYVACPDCAPPPAPAVAAG